jgi:hypothetical protein
MPNFDIGMEKTYVDSNRVIDKLTLSRHHQLAPCPHSHNSTNEHPYSLQNADIPWKFIRCQDLRLDESTMYGELAKSDGRKEENGMLTHREKAPESSSIP